MTKRFAFTLAEVLIALAIIGVVAAMTIPTFMANTAGAQFRTAFKKGITVLTQAASTNYATDDYDFAGADSWYGTSAAASTAIEGTIAATAGGVFGFDTNDLAPDEATHRDMVANAHSLYHIFKNNLNLKNSHEVTNYQVGIPDPSLDCVGHSGITINVPGTGDLNVTGVIGTETTEGEGGTTVTTNTTDIFDRDDNVDGSVGGLANLCAGRALSATGTGGINQGRMFMLEDGMVFTYDPGQTSCTENNPCYGYLDVNGSKGPNRVISCSPSGAADGFTGNANSYIRSYGRNMTGNEANLLMANCTVDAKDISDIFPVLFYGSTVKPASLAAKAVYYSQKSNQNMPAANP